MGRRRANPTSKAFDERLVVRKQESFDYGTVTDVEPRDIPYNAVAMLKNARGHKNAIKGRTGADKWSDLKIPPKKSLTTLTYSNGVLTCSSGCFDPDDAATTFYADTGDVLFITEFIDDSNVKVEVSNSLEAQTFVSGDIVPRINAQYYDPLNKVRYMLIGRKIYARVSKDQEWLEYFIMGGAPLNVSSQMFKLGEHIILTNSGGIFVLNSVYNGKYGWKSNGELPKFKLDERSEEITSTVPSAYNYVYTYTRMDGLYTEDRNSTDTFIEVETPPILVEDDIVPDPSENYDPETLNEDFTTVYVNEPISGSTKKIYDTSDVALSSSSTWVDYSVEGEEPNLHIQVGSDLHVVYFDFTNDESMADITKSLERGLRDVSDGFRVLREVAENNLQRFDFYHEDKEFDWEFGYTATTAGRDLINEGDLVEVTGIDTSMGAKIGTLRYPKDRHDITHYSSYRTKDIYPHTKDTTDILDPRVGNSPVIFSWVADIPVIETAIGDITEVTPGVYQLEATTDIIGLVGSEMTVDESNPLIKVLVGRPIPDSPLTYSLTFTLGVPGEYLGVTLVTGTDTMFTAEKIGQDITFTGFTPTEDDIGKPIFWADGTVSYLTSTTTTYDSDNRSSQRCYIDPTERVYYDTMNDITRDGYASYYTLGTRFYNKMPQSNIAVYNKGLLLTALVDYNKVYYTTTDKLQHLGYHNINQINDSLDKGVRCMFVVNDVFAILTTNSTHTINPKQSFPITSDFGEAYIVLPDAFLINGSIGGTGQFRWSLGEKGDVMVVTNEPAIRFFDGTKFTSNLADGKIQHTELQLLNENMITSYSSVGGIHIWGYRSDVWQET